MANEKRLIDAIAYCKELYKERDYPGRTQEFMDAIEVAIADLCDMPTVDAVEVVRCKDCKHWLHMEDGFGDCTNRRFHIDGCVDPTMKMEDFCSCGERRDNA